MTLSFHFLCLINNCETSPRLSSNFPIFSPNAIFAVVWLGLTNSMSAYADMVLHKERPNYTDNLSGSSTNVIFVAIEAKAAERSKETFSCPFANLITSIQFEPTKCPKITGISEYFSHNAISRLMPSNVTG